MYEHISLPCVRGRREGMSRSTASARRYAPFSPSENAWAGGSDSADASLLDEVKG